MSRSEREAQIKDKAGWVITLLAAILTISALLGNSNSSRIMQNTIAANNYWAWYQSKNIRQIMLDLEADRLLEEKKFSRAKELKAKVNELENDPNSGEGKKQLRDKARQLEAERDYSKKKSSWFTYSTSVLQISLVLLSASILAVSMTLYYTSIVAGLIGLLLLTQAVWLWLPI